jgi:hypothetical protein
MGLHKPALLRQEEGMGRPRHVLVDDFDALVAVSFDVGKNAACLRRVLDGDFGEVARAFAPSAGIREVDVDELRAHRWSEAGARAVDAIVHDLDRLDALGLDPVLNCIVDTPEDARGLPIGVDVMSFHADRAPIEVATWLCTYHGRPTEGLDNDDAIRAVDVADVRAGLMAHFVAGGGNDDDDAAFNAFLEEESFDLHYRQRPHAQPWSFGVGQLWRVAVEWPGALVPPCIHRAPRAASGDAPRLLVMC